MQYPHTPIRCREDAKKKCIAYNHTRDECHSFALLFWKTVRFSLKSRENTFYMSAILRLHYKYSNYFLIKQKFSGLSSFISTLFLIFATHFEG